MTLLHGGRGTGRRPGETPIGRLVTPLRRWIDVVRVLVNQAHTFGNGGGFDNGLPFTLSMGCGTWQGNSLSDNLNWRCFVNITHLVTTISEDNIPLYTRKSVLTATCRDAFFVYPENLLYICSMNLRQDKMNGYVIFRLTCFALLWLFLC